MFLPVPAKYSIDRMTQVKVLKISTHLLSVPPGFDYRAVHEVQIQIISLKSGSRFHKSFQSCSQPEIMGPEFRCQKDVFPWDLAVYNCLADKRFRSVSEASF